MPDKYHIKTVATPARFRRVGKYGSIDYREDCSRCSNCVKPRCLYDTYRKDVAHASDPTTSIQPLYDCRACFSCVQGCTKGLLSLGVNPEFLDMGDAYWKPDIMDTTWKQADAGRIPVSGAGYRGRFHGPGFDSIWTDMSEIVRPTRDGIHGREYISTSVDVGPKPMRLQFGPNGELSGPLARVIELQIPTLLDFPPWPAPGAGLVRARLLAAREVKSLAVVEYASLREQIQQGLPKELLTHAVPLVSGDPTVTPDGWMNDVLMTSVRMLEVVDGPNALELASALMRRFPELVVALRMPMQPDNHPRIVECAQAGIKVFHIVADLHGKEPAVEAVASDKSRARTHIKDALRALHTQLVATGVRDELTLIVGGGIALAEHMAKAIVCGADLVSIDVALLVAIGCRVCHATGTCAHEQYCPAEMDAHDTLYAAQRFINLIGAWHSQLIEVLGAMGMREVRRLRGEVGRAIFREDIEREAFSDLARKQQ